MIDKILSGLNRNNISTYLINEEIVESVELFFIKKQLDTRRKKDVHHYSLTVYNDFEKDGRKMRGSSKIGIYNGMTDDEISKAIQEAYYAASFVCNPYYEIPAGKKEEPVVLYNPEEAGTLAGVAGKMTEALFAEDKLNDVFINSAEIFVEKTTSHIINSNGIDVSYQKLAIKGEFVAQCIEPQDVEAYMSFSYDKPDTEALKEKVKKTLEMTKARASAKTAPPTGEYKVILSGRYVKEIFTYYLMRSSAGLIYPKYSNYELGMNVQGENVTGDALNITLKAKVPYSIEGIPMKDRPLLENGVLKTIHGNSRFSYYLGIEPTGTYDCIFIPKGTKTFDEMKTGEYLHVVSFSDFQMDELSGYFSGEIRLAFLCDGKSVTPVTGGSINGNLLECQKDIVLSKEMQVEEGYEGPFAISLPKVSVAGK